MQRPQPPLDEVMTFGEHLEALRWHLLRALAGVAVSMAICLALNKSLLNFLLAPLQHALAAHGAGGVVVRSLMEGLIIFLQVSLIGGLVLSSPWIAYQIWGFLAPGLYANERRMVHRSVPILVGLFLGGVFFGWFAALPPAVDFMVRFNLAMGFQLQITASSWVAFALAFPLAFGLAFELPLVMVLLARIGLVCGDTFRRHRKLVIVLLAVLSAVLTPSPDPLSMMMMLVPLVALYESGIWCVRIVERRRARRPQPSPNDAEHRDSTDLFASLLAPIIVSHMANAAKRAKFLPGQPVF